ncbi:hypothetical protein [Mucilaginibacter arboris]|uniref:Uncharacterized protein n=1 Tax=Mucilaginibacter arboris TaxID=2682090 RepID=A0A7K1SV22_9SPHI|nr:hypothetical protein [Mucilaginibacter arboris]MVN21088.1 hypothetical protein [Mucilaginibacter arboris]
MTTEELPPFQFSIMRILDCGFMIEEAISPENNNIQIGYGMSFTFDTQNDWIEYLIRTDFREKDSNIKFLSGTVLTRFNIANLVSFVDENQKINFPDGSLEILFGIAFGHMRAIVSKNIAGSRFSHFIIPIINQQSLFKELLEANIERVKKIRETELIKKEDKIRN